MSVFSFFMSVLIYNEKQKNQNQQQQKFRAGMEPDILGPEK